MHNVHYAHLIYYSTSIYIFRINNKSYTVGYLYIFLSVQMGNDYTQFCHVDSQQDLVMKLAVMLKQVVKNIITAVLMIPC